MPFTTQINDAFAGKLTLTVDTDYYIKYYIVGAHITGSFFYVFLSGIEDANDISKLLAGEHCEDGSSHVMLEKYEDYYELCLGASPPSGKFADVRIKLSYATIIALADLFKQAMDAE